MGKKNVDTIQEEAREEYDLSARLAGITKLTDSVTAYTDEITGKELGGVETTYIPNTEIVTGRRRWGVVGDQDALREKIRAALEDDATTDEAVEALKAENAALEKKKAALLKKLEKTAITLHLRALPELVVKSAKREAYRNLKLKPKGGLTPEQIEDVQEEFLAVILTYNVTSWTDAAVDRTFDSMTIRQARALKPHLRAEEWAKIERAIDELQSMKIVGDAATDSADF